MAVEYTRDDVLEVVLELVKDFAPTRYVPDKTHNLTNDVGLDSLDIVEYTTAIENRFNISIGDSDMDDMRTFIDVADVVMKHISSDS